MSKPNEIPDRIRKIQELGDYNFESLQWIVETLFGNEGCPWFHHQDHKSVIYKLREETEEVIEAIEKGDMVNLQEELGDLLLHALFHSQIARNNGNFSIEDVCQTLFEKLVRRHPHVFTDWGRKKYANISLDEVNSLYQQIKAEEKQTKEKL